MTTMFPLSVMPSIKERSVETTGACWGREVESVGVGVGEYVCLECWGFGVWERSSVEE